MDAINLLASIAPSTAFGAPPVPLQPGQVVQALVLELIQGDVFRLQLPQAVLDVRASVPLVPGSTVTLAVKGTGSAVRLDILGPVSAAPNAPPEVAAAAQTIRRPIGEAIIVGRANLPEAPAAPVPVPVVTPAPDKEMTPPRALAEAVRVAAARQGGLAPLFADADEALKVPTLPAPVRAVVTQLLGFRLPLDETLTAADVKQGFARSGLLLEPRLAAAVKPAVSAPATPAAPNAPASPSAPADDLKATLLVLRQALKGWATEAPHAAPAALTRTDPLVALPAGASPPLSPEDAESIARSVSALLTKVATASGVANNSINPPPPYRGAPLTAQAPVVPAAIPDNATPRATAERLIAGTDAALARQTLLQAASLPDAPGLDGPRDSGPRWTFEVPFATPQGTGVVPFEIARDGSAAPQDAQAAAWRARFSLDLEPMGPVHALITLSGDRASVTLWAERLSTATTLTDNAPLLGDALRSAELQPNELTFRVGTPRAAKPAAPGRFMDRAS